MDRLFAMLDSQVQVRWVDLQKLKYEPPNTDMDATTRIHERELCC